MTSNSPLHLIVGSFFTSLAKGSFGGIKLPRWTYSFRTPISPMNSLLLDVNFVTLIGLSVLPHMTVVCFARFTSREIPFSNRKDKLASLLPWFATSSIVLPRLRRRQDKYSIVLSSDCWIRSSLFRRLRGSANGDITVRWKKRPWSHFQRHTQGLCRTSNIKKLKRYGDMGQACFIPLEMAMVRKLAIIPNPTYGITTYLFGDRHVSRVLQSSSGALIQP